jgi:hypothetical protein
MDQKYAADSGPASEQRYARRRKSEARTRHRLAVSLHVLVCTLRCTVQSGFILGEADRRTGKSGAAVTA